MQIKNILIKYIVLIFFSVLILILLNYAIYLFLCFKYKLNFQEFCPFYRTNFSVRTFVKKEKFDHYNTKNNKDKSIIIFGCSFAKGLGLSKYENFAAQLADYTKRPVYNRAVNGGGVQYAQMQVESNYIDDIIKNTDTVIYVLSSLKDSARLKVYPGKVFQPCWILNSSIYPRYILKDDKLYFYRSPIPFIEGSILYRMIEKVLKDRGNSREIKENEINDLYIALSYLDKSLKTINPKVKLYVLLYHGSINEIVEVTLGKNPFDNSDIKLVPISSFSDINLNDTKYRAENSHPTSTAWKVIVPEFAKKFNL